MSGPEAMSDVEEAWRQRVRCKILFACDQTMAEIRVVYALRSCLLVR